MPKIKKPTVHPRGIVKEWPPQHTYSDGKGGLFTHEGHGRHCLRLECVEARGERPWGLPEEPDPGKPCTLFPEHRWRWGDDGIGHSGDVCECGAFEE